MDEDRLIEKLIQIEAMYTGTATGSESISPERARHGILLKLKDVLLYDSPIEHKFTFPDMWSRKVFVSLLRRYTLKPYRYPGQRYTTVMVNVPEAFVDETLWPEFQEINAELGLYLQQVTDRVIKKVLYEDSSEAEVVDQYMETVPNQEGISQRPANPPDDQEAGRQSKKGKKKRKKRKRKR